ncbi:hypothetical protein Sjap_000059 [Stephania japonica]|uniref:Phosphatidate cytidylyltransferase, mitochondrial n=1 Tax=Stephania japonica TaxID=461633 RepID=A0AAP0KJG4_9MAGN
MVNKAELASLLNALPPVEFCCAYGSSLLPNKKPDKETMVDYIIGVADPVHWHAENLKMNEDHYVSLIAQIGGAKLITDVADQIGVGVHFNPFVNWNDTMVKYGVVRLHDLVQDILNWDHLYLSGRLQKPVHIISDNLDVENVNSVNLRAAVSAALLLLPSEFTEEDLYAKICSLSYMGDLRMLFAEDRNKVKTIVQGQLGLFQTMYKPFLDDYTSKGLLTFPISVDFQGKITQVDDLSATRSLVSSLPSTVRSHMGMTLGEKRQLNKFGRVIREVVIDSRQETTECMRKTLRRMVMVSSARQAVSGLFATGGMNAARYLTKKMVKAWKSWR